MSYAQPIIPTDQAKPIRTTAEMQEAKLLENLQSHSSSHRTAGTREPPKPPLSKTYQDADPEEAVSLVGLGPMTLRTAVQLHIKASETPGIRVTLIEREAGKTPASFDESDLDNLSELDQYR